MWPNQGDLPYLPTSWKTYAELQQGLWELGTKNIIYIMKPQGPDEEVFTIGMRNLVLNTVPPTLFGCLVTIIALHIGQPISEATSTLADLGEVETIRAWKEVQATTKRRGAKGPMKVLRTHMWVDLIKTWGSERKT